MFYLNFNLTNFGSEPAYNAYVNFSSPNGIGLPIPLFESGSCINPDRRKNLHKKVDCLIQPMLQNHSKNLKFGFNFTNIDFAGRDNFKINAYLTSHCKNRLSKPMISPQIDIRLEYDYNFITKPSVQNNMILRIMIQILLIDLILLVMSKFPWMKLQLVNYTENLNRFSYQSIHMTIQLLAIKMKVKNSYAMSMHYGKQKNFIKLK